MPLIPPDLELIETLWNVKWDESIFSWRKEAN